MKYTIYKPSEKAVNVWQNAHKSKYRLLEGAVRSSKSYTADVLAINEIQKIPPCNVLISGYSISSVARNVLGEWQNMIDPKNKGIFQHVRTSKDDYLTIHWRGLKGKKFYIRGAGKEHDYKQVQGGTFGYWLADELTRHTESFVNMAVSRLSLPYSKAIWTTNPDSPYHFVKTQHIDRKKLYKKDKDGRSLYQRWIFFLNDNPSLADDFIDSLKQQYTGVYYDRYILSRWVAAEGLIYDFFSEDKFTIKNKPKAKYYHVSIDYGTGNPTVFLLFGINPESKPRIWVEREYYYDSEKAGRQKTDEEYALDFRDWLDGITPDKIRIDPSAASFRLQLRKSGYYMIEQANNDVLDGIRTVSRLSKTGEYKIVRGTCPNLVKERFTYVWDKKAQERGEDRPKKQNDHCSDAERYELHTEYGVEKIDYGKFTQW